MKKEYSYDDVRDAAKRGLGALYTLVRHDARAKLGKMTREEKYNLARSLVRLNDIAQDPEKFLSRATTHDAWIARATKCARDKKLPNFHHAFYFVPTPAMVAEAAAESALTISYNDGKNHLPSRSMQFSRLADAFMNYEYYMSSDKLSYASDRYALATLTESEYLIDCAAEIKAKWPKSAMLRLWHNCKQYEGR